MMKIYWQGRDRKLGSGILQKIKNPHIIEFTSCRTPIFQKFCPVLKKRILTENIFSRGLSTCHDNRDEDAAEKLLEEILFAVPVVKNKDTAVLIFPDGMYQSRKIQIQLAGNLIKY